MKPVGHARQFTHRFQAMGTQVELWLWQADAQRARQALTAGESFFARTEARLSRFRPDSELSRCNRGAGQPFAASPLFFDLVASALAWREQTGGIFDPTVLNALVAHGYDRSFDALDREPAAAPPLAKVGGDSAAPGAGALPSTTATIQLGPGRQIRLPAGVGLDLGGIAKGWTVQQVAHRLGLWGPCLVDAGGDIACVGAPPASPWVVPVANPDAETEDIAVLHLRNEAVATSSRVRRRWVHKGQAAHHLIDPRTGAPALTDLLSVTVVAPRLPDAEIHAKCTLILGERAGLAYLNERPGLATLLVTSDGRQLISGPLEEKAYVSTHPFASRF